MWRVEQYNKEEPETSTHSGNTSVDAKHCIGSCAGPTAWKPDYLVWPEAGFDWASIYTDTGSELCLIIIRRP